MLIQKKLEINFFIHMQLTVAVTVSANVDENYEHFQFQLTAKSVFIVTFRIKDQALVCSLLIERRAKK
jgi:hypothetical protein